jgi:hypothetical protein
MCTWAMVYMAKTKTMQAETYFPFFVAMAFDCGIFYWLASGIAGRAL